MNLPNIIYGLADGRMWNVPRASFLSTAEKARLEAEPAAPGAYDLIELVSASGESDEAYLLRTLDFYGYPFGALRPFNEQEIKRELEWLDAEYLTPRTLAGLATGDAEALARWQAHEQAAAPLRAKLARLENNEEKEEAE